ncbi:MAG: hypothetical protein KIT25_20255 [Enhydrobacter sp.]|nr:MAG: hypothetical protein KIT25_20255 [Enhydrobacter sp.]
MMSPQTGVEAERDGLHEAPHGQSERGDHAEPDQARLQDLNRKPSAEHIGTPTRRISPNRRDSRRTDGKPAMDVRPDAMYAPSAMQPMTKQEHGAEQEARWPSPRSGRR